jgi:AcrR family transcriptional regulator
MSVATGAKRGRPATASREEVLAAARAQYAGGERVDLTVLAARLGLGRATIYRWFGSRERLVGEVIADELEALIVRKRREVRRRGVHGLLAVFDRVNQSLAHSEALRAFLDQERATGMRLLTSSTGLVQARGVACITGLITAEVAAGRYEPCAEPETLAYAIVRLAEAFLYNDAAIGIRGDHARLREVEAALLGASRATLRPAATRPRRPPGARPAAPGPESL